VDPQILHYTMATSRVSHLSKVEVELLTKGSRLHFTIGYLILNLMEAFPVSNSQEVDHMHAVSW